MFYDGKGFTLRNAIVFILIFIALAFVVAWISDVAGADDAPPGDQVMAPIGDGWEDVQVEEWEELEFFATCDNTPWLCDVQYQQPEPEPYWEPGPPSSDTTDWAACQAFWDGQGDWQPGC